MFILFVDGDIQTFWGFKLQNKSGKQSMGNLLKKIFQTKMPKQKCKILMLGLDGSGKTTTLYKLRLGEIIQTIPTIGFNVEEVSYKTISFMVWDVGGQEKLRALWSHYFEKCKGLIFVVDSADQERISVAADELHRIMCSEEMRDAILLILANKRDIATMNVHDISESLRLNQMKRNWAIYPVCAVKEEGHNLDAAMQWLIDNINQTEHPKKVIKVG